MPAGAVSITSGALILPAHRRLIWRISDQFEQRQPSMKVALGPSEINRSAFADPTVVGFSASSIRGDAAAFLIRVAVPARCLKHLVLGSPRHTHRQAS
jgi:hypothetical protein